MELYVYRTPDGNVADFRPYLDGRDHSFDDPHPLKRDDPRWEKISNLRHPVTGEAIGGQLEFVGTAETRWRELMIFPIAWEREFVPAGGA
jgi:hypothetical protein